MEESQKNPKRVAAGRAGIGVKRKFSPEELERRRRRFLKFQHLGSIAIARRVAEDRRRVEAQKAYVKASASAKIFVPVQDFE
jgi:hypothetical protein